MAKKISELVERLLVDLDGTEECEIIDGAVNYRVKLDTILSLLDPVLDAVATDITNLQNAVTALEIYDVGGAWNGVPDASAVIVRFICPRAITFADEFAGAQGTAGVAATASTVFDVQKNGVSVGSITWALGATVPTFTTSGGAVAFAVGDILTVVAPATPDATLSNIAFTLTATRD